MQNIGPSVTLGQSPQQAAQPWSVPAAKQPAPGGSGVPRSPRRHRSSEAKPAPAASVATATGTPITVTSSAAANDRPVTSTVKENSAVGSATRMKAVSRPRRLSTPGTDTQPDTATGTGTTVAPGSTAETGTGRIGGFTFISSSLGSDAGPVDPVSMPLEGSASPPRAPSPCPRSAARQLRPTEPVFRPREHPQHAAQTSG